MTLKVVELITDSCSRVYGESPCTAQVGVTGSAKCYNTWATCQDRQNFERVDKPFYFTDARSAESALPVNAFPAVANVSMQATVLNPSGFDPRFSVLGKRASVRVDMVDFPDDGLQTDPYWQERPRGARGRSTFFAKLKSRNVYFDNRRVNIYEGEPGQTLEQMTRRSYFAHRFEGPDSRRQVRLVAKDVLRLIENKQALAPEPSGINLVGRAVGLQNDGIDATSTGVYVFSPPERVNSLFLEGVDGFLAIDNEIVSFRREASSPDGHLRIVARGQFNTDADEHETGEKVQSVLHYQGVNIVDILLDLIVSKADIDERWVDIEGWRSEGDLWLSSLNFTTAIAEPVLIKDLLSGLSRFGIYLWWDERMSKIRLNALRPIFSEDVGLQPLTDDNAFLRNSSIKEIPERFYTQLHFYFGLIDPLGSFGPENFSRLLITANPSVEREIEYGSSRISTLETRWISANEESVISPVSRNLLQRSQNAVLELNVEVPREFGEIYWTGDVVLVETDLFVDFEGNPRLSTWRIISAEFLPNTNVKYLLSPSDYEFNFEVRRRLAFVAPADEVEFAGAVEEDYLRRTSWISAPNGRMPDNTDPWVII